ncbi:MAG TPA: PKD domain-containing protein [Thermoanaerobaculia bacterium]
MRHTFSRAGWAFVLWLLLPGGPALAFTPSGRLEIHTINVQQGASTLVVGPDGTTVLLDAGRSGKGADDVVPYLTSLGLLPADGLDATLAGHLDADHIGGFDEVFAAGYDVRDDNWFNGSAASNATIEGYKAAAGETTAGPPQPIPLGHVIDLGDGARLTVVAVAGEVLGSGLVPGAAANENDLSVAVLLEYGDFDYLWAGDLGGGDDDEACTGRSTGQANVETPLALAIAPGGAAALLSSEGVDVLHVSHHGSESSTNSDWMNLLRPEVALIPVGAGQGGNFHHPRKAVVEGVLLAQAPCVTAPPVELVLQTAEGSPLGANTSTAGFAVGDVAITTDGSTYRVQANGAVGQGPDERGAAGLPEVFAADESGPCAPGDTTLCLVGGRFRVTVDWTLGDGSRGQGHAVPLTGESGVVWFFGEQNLEMLIKMVDACTFNDRFWFFFAATTDVELRVTVVDTVTGARREYQNPLGHAADPVQDTSAFATCGGPPLAADFSASCKGHRCQFTDQSTAAGGFIVDWLWNFGDGSDSIVPDPLHRYATAGAYPVELTVEHSDGATDTDAKTVVAACVPESQCCRVCSTGNACGGGCIAAHLTCHQGLGCACDAAEVCG